MGIYSNGDAYGIRWNIYKDEINDYEPKIKFEKIYTEKMNASQIQEVKEDYF